MMNEQVMLILSGLQGSGKSTFAKRLLEENPGQWVRVNWDTQRRQTPGYKFSKAAENKIKTDSYDQVRSAAAAGLSVVIDNTNLTDDSIGKWTRLGSTLGFHVRVQEFRTPISECVKRDAARVGEEFIGRAAIERQALWNGRIDFPVGRKIVIVDVDGTLADCSHRRKTKEKKCRMCKNGCIEDEGRWLACHVCYGSGLALGTDWDTFFRPDLIVLDEPRYPVVEWTRAMHASGMTVLIVSGRAIDRAGKATVAWLTKNEIPYHHIFMRNGGDNRDDVIVKQEILDKILAKVNKHQIAFAIDDRTRVVDMWRANGVKCYQVISREEGNF
jgi:predicted kinase